MEGIGHGQNAVVGHRHVHAAVRHILASLQHDLQGAAILHPHPVAQLSDGPEVIEIANDLSGIAAQVRRCGI